MVEIVYENLSDEQKIKILTDLYEKQYKSFGDIAEIYSTYPNKIRRDAKRLKIKIRDKSEAQKNALQTGKHKHPTKGKNRDESTKNKIGAAVLRSWEQLSDEELDARRTKARDNWENLSDDEKHEMQMKANQAVRKSSKEGSKLEKFLLDKLLNDNYKVVFHQEQFLSNTKLQIDLFIPTMNIAIEVDGPSHFLPVWGEDALTKNKTYDSKKEGLILGKGLYLIRIKQVKDFSKSRSEVTYSKLKQIIDSIQNKTLSTKSYTIED